MGLWTGIASLFSSNSKPVNDILDKDNGILVRTGGFLNDLHYSEQEQVRDDAEAMAARVKAYQSLLETATKHAAATQDENTQRSLTRRHIAIGIMRVELFLVLLCVVIYKVDQPYALFIWDVASSYLMAGAFMAVVIFFFGTYGYSAHLSKGRQIINTGKEIAKAVVKGK